VLSYPAMLYVGLLAGVSLEYLAASAMGLSAVGVYWATLVLLPIALIGSRLLFVATHWREYRSVPHRIWDRRDGGMAMYGGVPCMLLASIPLLPAFGLPYWRFWDVAVFCIFPGMAFTRVGCLLHGCCSGKPMNGRFTMSLPDHRGVWARRVPVQLLEAAAAVALLVICVAARRWLARPGTLFLAAAVGYAVSRLALQPARDQREYMGPLDVQIAISLAVIVGAIGGFVLLS
jgi:phosphatidylglycerol---prolipoprotein diacylglyceryl transferase